YCSKEKNCDSLHREFVAPPYSHRLDVKDADGMGGMLLPESTFFPSSGNLIILIYSETYYRTPEHPVNIASFRNAAAPSVLYATNFYISE
ncbi:MAG: hypothetical protein AAF387_14410, partial [Pseudomonadota bacterium]